MTGSQQPKPKHARLSAKQRIFCAGLAVGIVAGAAVLALDNAGLVRLQHWFGVCGFRQRFGLPCPGCGWTSAAKAFVSGHFFTAFWIQPAAAAACLLATATLVFSLLMAVFGIKFQFIEWLFGRLSIKTVLWLLAATLLAGWAVSLARSLSG